MLLLFVTRGCPTRKPNSDNTLPHAKKNHPIKTSPAKSQVFIMMDVKTLPETSCLPMKPSPSFLVNTPIARYEAPWRRGQGMTRFGKIFICGQTKKTLGPERSWKITFGGGFKHFSCFYLVEMIQFECFFWCLFWHIFFRWNQAATWIIWKSSVILFNFLLNLSCFGCKDIHYMVSFIKSYMFFKSK